MMASLSEETHPMTSHGDGKKVREDEAIGREKLFAGDPAWPK